MKIPHLALLLPLLLQPALRAAGEIGFIERFALAEDRGEVLKELIPGTEDYYFYSALHAQHENRLAEVAEFLEPWRERFGETPRYLSIRKRQALLEYGTKPADTLEFLKRELGLTFQHQQERLDAKPDFPTRLDPALVSREAFLQQALTRGDLSGITDAGLDDLLRNPIALTPAQRRELLSRLRLPDHEQLVSLIAADLSSPETQGFGEFEIHRRLTLAQLDELAGLRPELTHDPRFVDQRLLRLQPGADESALRNPAVEQAWNDRVWAYARTLAPAFNSMKAAVLYRRLELARTRGDYPEEDFLEYLRLPRSVPYIRREYFNAQMQRQAGPAVDLSVDHRATVGIPPIGSDEGLVREYLEHFFLTAGSTQRFAPYLLDTWLERVFAETKLLHGIGDASQWFARISPAEVQALKDRVEITFAPVNRERYAAADEVALTATLKNVPELIVKVYEINTLNFYRERGEEINTDLDLDGLVANEETVYRYDDAPVRRRTETFRFDSLTGKRGVWVIELIGNGISSRALVKKGELQALTQTSVGGEVLTVIDEANQPVPKAAAWFGGKRYEADEKGLILLPFSEAGSVPVVLTDGDFSSLARIDLPREDAYDLQTGFLLEQETLLPGSEAVVSVRAALTLAGEPVGIARLGKTRLTVKTTDLDGIESISEAAEFALFDDRESEHRFRVPARLRSVEVSLQGEIEPVQRTGDPYRLSDQRTFEINGVEALEFSHDVHLSRIGEGYILQTLGRSGEPRPDQPVEVDLSHHAFHNPVIVTLKSDARGRIHLGVLSGIRQVRAHAGGLERNWDLRADHIARSGVIHATAGEAIEIPVPLGSVADRSALAIHEVRAGVIVGDAFSSAVFGKGHVRLQNLAPGDYEVVLKGENTTLQLKVTKALAEHAGYALSQDRHLRLPDKAPLAVAGAEAKDGKLVITLAHADPRTRVHLLATRFVPEFDPFEGLVLASWPALYEIGRGADFSRFISGRDIGEEYRYILERRSAKKFPGNLLARPGLLLNPWELNETRTEVKDADKGEAYRKSAASMEAQRAGGAMAPDEAAAAAIIDEDTSPSLNFLAKQAVVLTNLAPAEDGTLTIELASLGDRQHLHLVAVGAADTIAHSFALPEPEGGAAIRDLRLDEPLDPAKHFTQGRKVTLLKEGQTLTVSDFRASEVQPYGTVAAVHQTLLAISGDEALAEFGFVTKWPTFDEAKKRGLYSHHACHELHFFLAEKDPAFFDAVVKPYLSNKKEKTFLDHYLLGDPLQRFLAPWEFGRLNIVERILLARRIGEDERVRTAGHVTSLYQLLPPDPEGDALMFGRGLRGRGADGTGSLNIVTTAGEMAFGAKPLPIDSITSGSTLQRRGVAAKNAMTADGFADAAPMPAAAAPAAPMLANGLAFDENHLLDRAKQQALYQTLDSTKELAENNYRHLPIAQQNADLVTVNRFWRDFANWNGEGGFYSREFAAATRNFTEMMFALSVLDLPFEEKKHQIDVTDNVFKLTAASPLVVFHEEFEEAPLADDGAPILVSQNFLRTDDRQREEDGQMVDKFITGEFLTGRIYSTQVVVTNPTSSYHRLDLLVQIPEGAVPVAGSDYTKSHPLNLAAFSTENIETLFYFPSASQAEGFRIYPVQVAKNGKVIAAAEARRLVVVDSPSEVDETSWDHLSQFGTEKQVLDYLAAHNLHRIDLSRIAWRVRESVDFLRQATAVIASRHAYDATLWSYGLHHNDTAIAREFLKHHEDLLKRSGKAIECELVRVDPVERHWYQQLDYAPLVNARTHRLGRDHRILNDRFHSQYGSFLEVLAYRPQLSADDRLGVAAYLSLQDRIEEAISWLDSVPAAEIASKLQYDYLRAYHAFHREDLAAAKEIAARYAEYPVDKWRQSFAEVARQVTEVEGAAAEPDKTTREGRIERLTSQEPFLDLTATGRELTLRHRNLQAVTVNYYEMDLEFLFSSRPFVSAGSGGFAYIRPNLVETKELPAGGANLTFGVPAAFASKNVLVEVSGGGKTSSVAVYANTLDLRLTENYGRLELRHEESGKPVGRAYVKVYARMGDGSTRFFKDGYTDLRGIFDYSSLSTDELDRVERLSLLVMSESDGSLVREVNPPQR